MSTRERSLTHRVTSHGGALPTVQTVLSHSSRLTIIRNFVGQNVGDGKCSSEGKGPQKTGGQGRSEGKGPHSFWIGPCPHVLAWASPWVKCGLEDTTSRP